MGSGANMKSGSLRSAVLAIATGSLVAWMSVAHVAPAFAQGVFAQGGSVPQRPARITDAASAKTAVEALVVAFVQSGENSAEQLRRAIARLLLTNPGFAQEITAAVIAVSESGVPGLPANDSLTGVLADGVAIAVAYWQRTGANGSPVAQAAIEGVNLAFVAGGVSNGSVFGVAFTSQLGRYGGAILPPVLRPPSEILTAAILFVPKDETSNVSPNSGGNL